MSESGSVVWPSASEPIWRFNYFLPDNPDVEGLVISHVSFRNRKVLSKASLPSLRVQYDGPCGPWKDPLNYNNSQVTTVCPSQRVCLTSYVSNGHRALQIQSYHRVESYRLTHRWVFWEHGHLYPRLYSAGLQCPYSHRHHAYWRMDFDIGDIDNDLVLQYDTYTPDLGFGNGWAPITAETARVKNPPSKRSWAVLDKRTGRGYHISPGANDGKADTFAAQDLWILRYQPTEDKHGRQGSEWADGLDQYLNGESVDGQDVVVWYCGHLFHQYIPGHDEWHHTGPNLFPFANWDWA